MRGLRGMRGKRFKGHRAGRRLAALVLAAAAFGAPRAGVFALEPVSHYHDLVAGAGVAGFKDGEFFEAQFRFPAGLAVLARRGLVVVADRENHRIRAIHANEKNRVETLAGTGARGSADGALAAATFDRPSAIAAISDDAVVVHDEGSALLRLVDLAKGRVETLAGNGGRGVGAGAARSVPLGGVWNLLFVPSENALYFTQPEEHALRRLDLASATRNVETLLSDHPSLPRPAALALHAGRVCVADRNGLIVRLGPRTPAGPSGAAAPPTLEELTRIERLLSLAASGDQLFGTFVVGEGEIAWTCVTTGERGLLPAAVTDAPPAVWLRSTEDSPGGFVADPGGDRSFFLTLPSIHAVVSLKDYRFRDLIGAAASDPQTGLVDFAYPLRKPVGTFRILLLGDSRMFHFVLPTPRPADAPEPVRMETAPKRMELYLNSLSGLDDGGTRFEVLALTRASWEPLLVWPNYHVPDVVKKYDVDLVLLMQPPSTTTVDAYIERPITEEGIPADGVDPEHLLEPFSKKIRNNPVAPFVERARQLGWLKPHAKDQFHVEAEIPTVLADPVARREMLKLFARPLGGIREGIRKARPQTAFALCYFPFGGRGTGIAERPLWQELARMTGSAFLDTVGAFTALKDTWGPYSEPGYEHFSPQGHAFFGFVVAHELLASGLVPYKKGGAVRMKVVEAPKPAAQPPSPSPMKRLRLDDWKFPAALASGGLLVGIGIGLLIRRRNS